MTDLRALLEPIRERLAAATPGPWEARVDDLTDDVDVVHDQEQLSHVASCGDKKQPRALADAELIANAPTDLTRLLAAVEEVLGISEIKMTSEHGDPAFVQGWECAIEEMHARVAAALGSDTTNQEGSR